MGIHTTLHADQVVISTTGLTKAFGKVVAVNNLNLQVSRGDVFGFLGPNGSGKTTTIRMLLGLIRPTAGQASIFGVDSNHATPAIRQRLGAIVETPVFYPYLSGIDNLRVIGANSGIVSGKANNVHLESILDIVDLRAYATRAYSKYSLGMKQRLGIAAALLTDPELIMLDEPTNGLDPAGMIEIRQLIRRLAEAGKTVFISSHLLAEVQQVCNRVAILRRGNLIQQGLVHELLRSQEQIEIRMGNAEENERALAFFRARQEQGSSWIKSIKLENHQQQPAIVLEAPGERSVEVNRLLAEQGLFAAAIYPREGSLESIFMELTAADQPMNGMYPPAMQPGQYAPPPMAPVYAPATEPEKGGSR